MSKKMGFLNNSSGSLNGWVKESHKVERASLKVELGTRATTKGKIQMKTTVTIEELQAQMEEMRANAKKELEAVREEAKNIAEAKQRELDAQLINSVFRLSVIESTGNKMLSFKGQHKLKDGTLAFNTASFDPNIQAFLIRHGLMLSVKKTEPVATPTK